MSEREDYGPGGRVKCPACGKMMRDDDYIFPYAEDDEIVINCEHCDKEIYIQCTGREWYYDVRLAQEATNERQQ